MRRRRMADQGIYEIAVQKALASVRPGPWRARDLESLEPVINDEFCLHLRPGCRAGEVLDWLRSLSDEDRRELVDRLNEKRRRA
jgi:hypothetical protein